MKYTFCALICMLSATCLFAQKSSYTFLSIADSLKLNANAIVRVNQTDLSIASQREMKISTTRIVTVLNEKGMDAIDAAEAYDKKTNVRRIEAIIFDGLGNEIKRIKRKDFTDQSIIDGSTLFSESRVIFLNYTPTQYPFTIVYESEVNTSNTAFIPQWYPVSHYFVSVEKNILNVRYPENLGFKKKECNLLKFSIEKTTDTSTQLSYTASNIAALKEEYRSPEAYNFFPKVMMGLEVFHLEGVDGNAKTWKEFGQWYSQKILSGTTELPAETKAKVIALVGNEKDPIQKAKIIYNYVQQKSRYVSIQVGIGGWKPMFAHDVDRLGYGDCKALTNYTKSLMDVVGVPSYYTILYGDMIHKRDIVSDFVSMQGNHVMLTIPNGEKYIWLECTSQDAPFGYQANSTDDRDVLIIKPDGGEIVRTKDYQGKDNSQVSKGNYAINEMGDFSGDITIVSQGAKYDWKNKLENTLPTEKEAHYKEYWDNISNLKIGKITFGNDKEKIAFTENLSLNAVNYGMLSGNKMLVVVNAFNQSVAGIKRIRNRKTPFEILRGFYDSDEVAVALPKGFSIEALPKDFELKSKFGEYQTQLIKKDDSNLVYKRSLLIKKGSYASNEYEEYRLFMDQISRNDNSKIILNKNL